MCVCVYAPFAVYYIQAMNRFGVEYQSLLVDALVRNDVSDAISLLQQGRRIDLNLRDHSGRCPLDYCVETSPKKDYTCYKQEKDGDQCKDNLINVQSKLMIYII